MARTKGMLNLSGNLEVNAGAPLDARTVVPTVADLIVASNFQYKYVGMPVVVQATGDMYILTANDVTVVANWKPVGKTYTAGTNVNISDQNVISATDTTYTAGDGIDITNDEISTDNMPAADMSEIVTPLPSVMSRLPRYSTEEQIVGYWIDGKPVYQRTFTTVLPDTTADGVAASAYISNSVISNVDKIISIEGVQSSTDGVWFGNVFYVDGVATVDNTLKLCSTYILYNKSDGIRVGNSIYRYNGRNVTVTIRYTKTTD